MSRKFSKATTILFDPQDYKQLEQLALVKRVSVSNLIRTAVQEKYLYSAEERIRAVEALSKMREPSGSPEDMEMEIEKGRLK